MEFIVKHTFNPDVIPFPREFNMLDELLDFVKEQKYPVIIHLALITRDPFGGYARENILGVYDDFRE
jgi:hypothetical protein